jgi:hypothetical protein
MMRLERSAGTFRSSKDALAGRPEFLSKIPSAQVAVAMKIFGCWTRLDDVVQSARVAVQPMPRERGHAWAATLKLETTAPATTTSTRKSGETVGHVYR